MVDYIIYFVKVFVITFVVIALTLLLYKSDHEKELQPCNSNTKAVHYYNNLPSNPPLKMDRRWV